MWVKVDDQFPNHDKVIDAGVRLDRDDPQSTGATGRGRVMAVWQAGMCHSNSKLLDGFIGDAFVTTDLSLIDRNATAVLMAMRGGLVRRVKGGWRFCNADKYQPTKADIEKKRELARKRVQKWRRQRNRSVTRYNRVGNTPPNASVTLTPARSRIPAPVLDQDQDPRFAPRALADVRQHVKAALHQSLDADPTLPDSELVAQAKDLARPLGFVWHPDEITAIVNSVRGEREKRRAV